MVVSCELLDLINEEMDEEINCLICSCELPSLQKDEWIVRFALLQPYRCRIPRWIRETSTLAVNWDTTEAVT